MNELLWVDPLSRVEIEERAEGFLRAHAPSVLMSLQPTPIFAIFDAWIRERTDLTAKSFQTMAASTRGSTRSTAA